MSNTNDLDDTAEWWMFLILLVLLAIYNFATWHSDTISSASLLKAEQLCEDNGGIEYIRPSHLTEFKTRCVNGAEFAVPFQQYKRPTGESND